MNTLDAPLWAHYAGCGCEGLTCWACGAHFEKGQRYYTYGITKLCKLCAGRAVEEWLNWLIVMPKRGNKESYADAKRATQPGDGEAS